MDWSGDLGAAGIAALVTGVVALAVPRVIALLPEPEPEPEPEEQPEEPKQPEEEPKELYVDLAARPRLAVTCALVSAAAGGLIGLALGWAWPLVYLLPLVPLMVALSVIDFRTRLLPTRLIWPCYAVTLVGVVVCWVASGDTADLVRAGVGWLIAGAIFFILWFVNPRGMGYGDVRLSGVLGLGLGNLGWGALFTGLYSGFLIFALPGLLLALVRWDRSLLKAAYPFGPFMVIGGLVGVLWGEPLWGGLVGG